MAMNSDIVVNTFESYIQSKYPTAQPIDKADIKYLVDLLIIEIKKADISINITSPLGLVAGFEPVVGAAMNAGSGTIIA